MAELSGGFHSKLANDEVTFMILEGAMIIIAVAALTVTHPCFAFGSAWGEATWSLRGRKDSERGMGGKESRDSLAGEVEMG